MICPGEASCDRFQSTAGKTHKTKVRKACGPCPLLPTKTDEGKTSHRSCVELVERAFRVRREKVGGYPRSTDRISNVEFEAYLVIDELCEQEDIQHRHKMESMLMAGFGLKVK